MGSSWQQITILLLVAATVAGLLAGCDSSQPAAEAARTSRAVTVRVAPAATGSISITTSYSATIEARDLVNLVPLTSGRVETLSVDLGSEVQQGQVIAELSHGTLDAQLQQAEAALRQQKAKLVLAQSEAQPNRIKAQAELDAARANLAELLSPSASSIQVAESAVAKSQHSLDSARTKLNQLLNPSEADLAAARAEVAQALSELSEAEIALDGRLTDAKAASVGGELSGLWEPVLLARQAIESNRALLYNPSFRAALTPEEVARAEGVVATNRQTLVAVFAELGADSVIPEGIRYAFWVESEALAELQSAQAALDELTSPRPDTIDLLQQDILTAQADLDAARARLDLVRDPGQANLSAAETKVVVAEQTLALDEGLYARHDLETAQAQVAEAQARVDMVHQQLAELQVVAPFDGVVTRRWTSPGALASAQSPIVTLASQDLVVSVRVDEASVGSLRQGQGVTLTSPALPGAILDLQIDRIAPIGDEKAHTFLFHLSPVEAVPDLKPGMSGQVSFVTQHDNVVLVPKSAVLQKDEGPVIFVAQDNQAQLRPVVPGLVDVAHVEILNGLRPGESVVVSGQGLLKDGDTIAIEQPGR